MIKRLLLLTLISLHATSYCMSDLLKKLALHKDKIAYGTASLIAGVGSGYYLGLCYSNAAVKRKQFDLLVEKQQKEESLRRKAEQDRLEAARLEEKEKREKEEALKAAILRKKQAADFAISIAKEYYDEIELIKREKFNEHNHEDFSRIILSKNNQMHFNKYDQRLDKNIAELAQLKDNMDKPQFEFIEYQLNIIRKNFNFLFSIPQREESLTAQNERNKAEIKRIEIEHAQLQNQKLQNEQDALVETKKALRSFSEHNRELNKTLKEMHASNQQIAATVNTYKNDVNNNIRAHEANHQRIALQLQSRETMLDRKFEAQAVEVIKMNTQLTEVLAPLKQLAKIAAEASKASATGAHESSKPVTENPSPVTSSSSTTTSSEPATSTQQVPPPTYDGHSSQSIISSVGIQGIPVPK